MDRGRIGDHRGCAPRRARRSRGRVRSTRKDAVETGTIEQALPGLEIATPRTEMSIGRALPLTPQKRLMVFSGRSHPELAGRMAEQLGVELGEVELETFANGETYCRYIESIRGADVFLVQTGCRAGRPESDGAAADDPGGAGSRPRSGSPRSSRGSRTRARIGRRSRASRSRVASSPTCSSSPAPTAS